jgi:hypothetical protein
MMATPSDGVGQGLFGAESSTLGGAEDTVGRGSTHRHNADSETDDDEDEELRPPLDIPLFAVEKVLAVRSRSKDAGGEVRQSSSTSSPAAGGSARASNDPSSGAFAGEDDASGAAGRAPRAREGRREFVAAACTSEATARPGDPPATHVFHAAAHASEEGTRHHLLLRAERVASDASSEGAGTTGTASGASGGSDALNSGTRALPWYEGEHARITSLEFSPPCCSPRGDGPLLLCGTRGGGVYVIPAGAALAFESESESDASAAPAIRVLCTSGSPIVSALWWRKHKSACVENAPEGSEKVDTSSLVAVACARNGEIRFWSASGAPLCAVFVGGRASFAAAVDAGPDLGQFLLISGERASVMAAQGIAGTSSRGSDAYGEANAREADAQPKAHWTLALERGGASLPDAAGRRGFSPTLVEGRFGAPPALEAAESLSRAVLSVHVGAHDGTRPDGDTNAPRSPLSSSLVARLSAAAETLALFHPANDRDAIATYRVPPGTIAVRVTRRLIFALHRRSGGRARLSALAREDDAASRAPEAKRFSFHKNEDETAPPPGSVPGAASGAWAGAGAGATYVKPVWRYLEIVPVVLQELTLSAGVGRPLARALLPCGDRRGEDKEWVAAFEGCAVAAQGATLACRPATPSSETVVRGLLGTAQGAEADAFARAARRAAGKDAARRRGDAEDVSRVVGSSTAFRPGGPGDFQAETLLSVLGVARARRAVLYAEAVERAASVGDVSRAARLAPKAAPKAATAMCVAACLGEWRAADALDHLDHLASTRKILAERATEANEKRKTRDDPSMSRTDRDRDRDPREDDDEAWLRLCCAAHLELSAWAASAAAAAIGAAGEIAEELPDASASFPWPSGALSPPLAADAADALARSAAEATPAHRSLGSLQAAARAARRAADAAAGITAFVRGTVFASARGDDEKTRAARRDAVSLLRVTLAAGSAADTFHRGGDAMRRYVAYAAGAGALGGSIRLAEEDEEDEEEKSAARSPSSAARAVFTASTSAARGSPGGRLPYSDESRRAIVAVLPLMRPEETAELAASASGLELGSGAAEIRVAALLSSVGKASRARGAAEARQSLLERLLREGLEAGTVRPQWAIAATVGFENASAAAVALASVGDWLAATKHRLRAVDDAFGKDRADSAVQAALASTLADYASRAETVAVRASALAAVARAWRARGLSREALETLLLADADAVGAEALAALLRAGKGDASDASGGDDCVTIQETVRSDAFPFSASFALEVASLRVRAAARGDDGDEGGASETEELLSAAGEDGPGSRNKTRETESSRWSKARAALCADEAVSAAAYFSAREFAAPEMRRDEDGVAFTCGHVVCDTSLRASAAALADAWRDAGCPMSGDLVAAEYAKRRVALACPTCVGAAARDAFEA